VPIRGLAGSSAGAPAAAGFAFGHKDPYKVHEAIFDPDLARLAQGGGPRVLARLLGGLRRPHLAEAGRLEEGLKALFSDALLEESPIPLAIQAADLLTGEAVVLRQGPVLKAVLASMAIPGLFPLVAWEGRLLVDWWTGTWRRRCPCGRPGPSSPRWWPRTCPTRRPRSRPGRPAALLAGEASRRRLKELALKEADLVIALDPPFPIYTFDHGKISLVYQLGQRRAWERLQEVQALAQVRLKDLLPAFLKAGPPPAKGG